MRRLTTFSLLMLGLVACEEDLCPELTTDTHTEEVTDSGDVQDTGDTQVVEDLVNPYAYVGEQHNVYLDCVREVDARNADQVLGNLIKVCGYEDSSATQLAGYIDHVQPSLHDTGAEMGLSAAELSVLAEVDHIVRTYEPGEALLELEWLEQRAIRDLGPDAEVVLSAVATARSSGAYWDENWDDNPPASRAKWWQILLADAGGALVGAVVAGPAGGIALGTTASTLVAKDGD
jgi:hypothetical protein